MFLFSLCDNQKPSLSADEFLVGINAPKIIIDLQHMRRLFAELPVDGYRYKLNPLAAFPCDLSTRDNTSIPITRRATTIVNDHSMPYYTRKTFYFSRSFVSTAEGNHFGSLTVDKDCTPEDPLYDAGSKACQHQDIVLGVVHYGAAYSFLEFDRKMIRGAIARGHNITVNDVNECQGYGVHYCRFIAKKNRDGIDVAKKEYEAHLNKMCSRSTGIHYPAMSELLESLATRYHSEQTGTEIKIVTENNASLN